MGEPVERRKMFIDVEKQQGQIVWAKMGKKSKLWAAIILSAKKMDLVYFEDKPGKTCVWWLGDDTMSQLQNDLIFEFRSNLKKGIADLTYARKENFEQAIYILSLQFNFEFPKHGLVNWALMNLPIVMKGKNTRKEEFFIPDQFLKKITMVNNRIKRNIEEDKEKNVDSSPNGEKIKIDVTQISKMENQYCIACRLPSDDLKIKHPIFKGFLCNDCFTNGKDIILSIAKDKSNDGCCICLTQKDTLVLCGFCIRAYCNECLEFYCGQKALENILKDNAWACIACSSTTLKISNLVPRSTKEQLRNIYMLYPANAKKDCAKEQYKIKEIHVMNLKDIQNNVPKVLQTLRFPFKILETSYLNDNNQDNNKSNAKFVIQYYPNKENYDKDKFFDRNDCLKKFFLFLLFKNKMQALQKDGKLFWAFETSAAIKVKEQRTISRFLEIEPIIIGMDTDDVQQRSRFIWTNVTILNKDIRQFTNQNIYLHEIPKSIGKRSKKDKHNIDMPWCYTSIYTILSSFIKNDII
ncbi:DNA (cytosine-5)-methyltransferase 3A-like [Metopolophium dirhodum]|uniref:DNA (cytosine-5)-methyltransferase 3A-like n=1 Tax=Metopolophium dirhodum TaxID=44670 RepID=UPI00298F4424|nr:DNA (cytosine-5)-methyltransferase 3A-like [Metopolophium dirhodum]